MNPADNRRIRIAAAQFEHRDGDKEYNLSVIDHLTGKAVERGADVVSFHECSISAYSFVQSFSAKQLHELAEPVPDGPSIQRLMQISRKHGVPVLAGLFERRGDEVFNTYVCVDGSELLARFSKLHAFVNGHLACGSEYVTFSLKEFCCSILICYDNNLPENVRAATLLGAEIVFMPHVTGCLPSVMPGRGTVPPTLWHNRRTDPARLRKELDGPKGREWLMRWLPTRAWENGIYAVYSNPIGIDDGQVRPGNAMILDPFGEILDECRELDDGLAIADCVGSRISESGGRRYLRARRPELYTPLTQPNPHSGRAEPGWDLRPSE